MLAGVLAACRSPVIEDRAGPFWEAFQHNGFEVSHFKSLEEMLEASDTVVIARVRDVAVSRVFQGDAPGDRVPYIRVELVIDRVIAGNAPPVVQLEFLGGGNEAQAATLAKELKERVPVQAAIVFLHEKRGDGEAGLYRVTNSTGLWTETARARLATPLRGEPPQGTELYAEELANIATIDGLLGYLASLAQASAVFCGAEIHAIRGITAMWQLA